MTMKSKLFVASALTVALLSASGCSRENTEQVAQQHIDRAETFANQGQYRSALLEIRNALQKEPGNAAHVKTLAETYIRIGASREAAELLEPWMADYGDTMALTLAQAYIMQGKHLSARDTLNQYSPTEQADQLDKQTLQAEVLRRAGQPDAAAEAFRSVLNVNPDHREATQGLARALLDTNAAAAAQSALEQWRARNGEHPEVLYLLGLSQYRQGRLEAATETLTAATTVLPTADVFLPIRRNVVSLLSRTFTERGMITEAAIYNRILAENTSSEVRDRAEAVVEAINRGEIDSARAMLEELMLQFPDDDRVAMMLGALQLQTGERGQVDQLLVERIDAETTPTPFLRAAAVAQIDQGKRDEALQVLARAAEARPNDVDILAMYGVLALASVEHHQQGIASLNKALTLDPSRTRLRLALAQHHASQGQQEQALGHLRKAFTELPTDWPTTNFYLSLLLETGTLNEAEEIKQALINGYGNERQAVLLASLTDFRLGNESAAINRLQRLTQAHPDWQAPLISLATIHQRRGENAQAIDVMIKAAVLNPDNPVPLQQAGRVYASEHTPDQVVDWLLELRNKQPELSANATGLAALIRLQQQRRDEARSLLQSHPAQDNRLINSVNAQLKASESQEAAQAQDWRTAKARAQEAIALEPGNLNFALIPVTLAALENGPQSAFTVLDDVESVFGQRTETILVRARLHQANDDRRAAWTLLESQWSANEDIRLLPALIGIATTEAPEQVDSFTRTWVERQPESPAAYLARANHQMAQNDDEGAITTYERLLTLQPTNVVALNNMAWLLRERNNNRAQELAARANDIAPNTAAILDTYGWVLHLGGQHQRAKELIERALELEPGSTEIRENLEKVKQAL